MKNFSFLVLIAFLAIACNQNNTTIVLSGKITNPLDEPTGIKINYLDRNDTVIVNSDGTFLAEISLDEEHLSWFGHGMYAIPLYLVPGAKINIEFDAKEFEGWRYSNAQIKGKKSEASVFLYSLDFMLNKPSREELTKMKVDSFLTIINNLEKITTHEIEKFISDNSPSDKFIERIELKQKVGLGMKCLDFTKHYQNNQSQDKSIPSYLQKYLDAIPTNDKENIKEISEYWYFLYQYFDYKVDEKMEESGLYKETSAYINKLADEIIALDIPQEVKDYIGERNFSVFYKRPDSLRKVYIKRYYDVVKNQDYINEFDEAVAVIEKTKPRTVAPSFNYPDINGNMVSSESLKGKVIYIDVWATWCGPCKGEIPYQKKLEEELHNEEIAFVSISVDEDKSAWEEMVKDKDLGGYQLYAKEAGEADIIRQYGISGIPRFIIIDKKGKIVEAYASRPSNPETKEKLMELARR